MRFRNAIFSRASLHTIPKPARPAAPAEFLGGISLRGEAFFVKSDGVRRRMVGTAAHFEMGEQIIVGPNSRLQTVLPDDTVFTLGPDSDMKIDEFVYYPNSSAGKVTAQITKGFFRFVTGFSRLIQTVSGSS